MSATIERTETQVKSDEPRMVVRRFSAWTRATHAVLAGAVFGLVLTGMPLRYPDAFWAKFLLLIWQGFEGAAKLHRLFACGFFLAGGMHIVGIVAAWLTGRFRFRSIMEPDSILLRPQDLKNIVGNLKYLQGKGPRPEFGRFTYWEKFDYFAEIWGLLVIGLSGLVMWFPMKAASFLPGWIVNAALIFHAYEGLLAMGFLFSIHFFNTHLRPDVFPVDPVIFSGNIPLEEVRERYPGWYQRLAMKGTGFVPGRRDPSSFAMFVSVAYLSVGLLTLTFVMMDAVMEAWKYLSYAF